jgi:hypothetical protein
MSGPSMYSFINMSSMIEIVDNQQSTVRAKLSAIQAAKSSISIADMFDMQMLMNKLSQFSEMTSAVVSSTNSAIKSMTSGIRGQ